MADETTVQNTNGTANPPREMSEAAQFLDQLMYGKPSESAVPETPEQEAQPPAITLDYDAEIGKLQEQLSKKEKQYNDLQSDIDRRVNVATKQATTELNAKIDSLIAALSGRSNPAGNPNDQTGQFGEDAYGNALPNQKQPDMSLIRQEIQRAIDSDEGVKAGRLVKDLQAFRAENPDSGQYDFIMQKVFSSFPHLLGMGKQGMEQALAFSKTLILDALQQAKSAEEAKKPAQVTPQSVKQPITNAPSGAVSPQQAQELAARAERYSNNPGVSVSAEAKPNVDWNSVPSLEQGVNKLAEMMLNRKR